MIRRLVPILAALVTVALVALPATAAKKKPREHHRIAAMSGQEEKPGPGDPDGYGAASIRVKGNKVCFVLLGRQIEPANAAHIHKAPAGEPGPVVVDLFSAKGSQQTIPPRISGCAKTTAAIAKDIVRNTSSYYVNVHNDDFPNGAIRGQLSK